MSGNRTPRVPALKGGASSHSLGEKDPRARRNAQQDRAQNQALRAPLKVDSRGRISIEAAPYVKKPNVPGVGVATPTSLDTATLTSGAAYSQAEAAARDAAIVALESKVNDLLTFIADADLDARAANNTNTLRAMIQSLRDTGIQKK